MQIDSFLYVADGQLASVSAFVSLSRCITFTFGGDTRAGGTRDAIRQRYRPCLKRPLRWGREQCVRVCQGTERNTKHIVCACIIS